MHPPLDPPPPPPASSSRIPSRIGHYRIVRVLGEGGMGTVYEAEQDHPHRRVALKVIRAEYTSPELLKRFAREAEVLGRLQHPGIAQIYEASTFDESDGARPFFAMELVKGEPLTAYADNHAMGSAERLALFARVCDAVHYAHEQGVIHRDLKPANILVTGDGQPKILDFGVALVIDAEAGVTRQTSAGEVIGTLQYMSPEQVNADPVQIDVRSDVYSLGVVLYELLSRRLPYDLSSKMIFEAARAILVDDPAPLSAIDHALGGDVEIIVGKALEKERQRRYSSANDLASDVRRFLSDEPIAARRASAVYQLRKFARRNRALVGGLVFGAAVLVAGTAVSSWQAIRATAAERLAESRRVEATAAGTLAEERRQIADIASRRADSARLVADSSRENALRQEAAARASAIRATEEAAKATAANAFLRDMLGASSPGNARGRELTVREVLDSAALRIDSGSLADQPEVRAGVQSTIGRTYYALGLFPQARPHLDSAYAIRRRVLGANSTETATSAGDLGEMFRASGNFAAADTVLTQSLAIARRRLPPDDDQVTGTMSTLAGVKYSLARNAEAERLHRDALRLTRARHGDSAAIVGARLNALGGFLLYTGRPEQALPELERALRVQRRVRGDTHPAVVGTLIMLGDAQRNLRRFASAESTFRHALPLSRRLFGAAHPTIADVLSRLGGTLSDQRRLEAAEAMIRESVAMRIALLGAGHPDVQLARVELGRTLQLRAQYAEAETLFTLALEGRRATLGPMSPAVAASMQDLGMLAKLQERWPEVEKQYSAAVPIWRAAGIDHEVMNSQGEVGFALSKMNRLDEAERILLETVAQRRARFGDSHWFVGDAYEKLAGVEMGRGNIVKAESLGARGLAIRRAVYGERSAAVAGQLQNMAFYREALADTAGAIPLLRTSLGVFSELRPASDINVVLATRWLAVDLCTVGATAEGDSLLRRAMAVVPLDSMQSLPYRLRAGLGHCLARQRRFDDAEPLLLEAERRLRAIPTVPAPHRAQAASMLAGMYELWGKPDQAARWRAKR